MYIKLSFKEEIIIIPTLWGGLAVYLKNEPEITSVLPSGIKANTMVNKTCNNNEAKESERFFDYDYYYDCGKMKEPGIQKLIQLLQKNYKEKYKEEGYNGLCFVADEDKYPQENLIIQELDNAVNELQYPYHFSRLFSRKPEGQAKLETNVLKPSFSR